jgi:hypothetical protein
VKWLGNEERALALGRRGGAPPGFDFRWRQPSQDLLLVAGKARRRRPHCDELRKREQLLETKR